jgi:hypothetical protein
MNLSNPEIVIRRDVVIGMKEILKVIVKLGKDYMSVIRRDMGF